MSVLILEFLRGVSKCSVEAIIEFAEICAQNFKPCFRIISFYGGRIRPSPKFPILLLKISMNIKV